MDGLMMDYPLTLNAILRRVERLFPDREIVTRRGGRESMRIGYGAMGERVRRVAAGLAALGVGPGDRVATICMNHQEHVELYFAVPLLGAVLHTINPRLRQEDLAFIVRDAEDRVVVVDEHLVPVWESFRERVEVGHAIVVEREGGRSGPDLIAYEQILRDAAPDPADPDERRAAMLCYTSGTTGSPKGVLYSHRALVLHSLTCALGEQFDVREADRVLPVVPQFHVNAWGLPFTCAIVGASQVMPGPDLGAQALLAAIEEERVTLTAGVPTVWLALLEALDRDPAAHDVSTLRTVIVGGSAAPVSLISGMRDRHGLDVVQAWGMTEMTPVGTVSRPPPDAPETGDDLVRLRATQGRPLPFVETRMRGDAGLVEEDGVAMGELEVRGPWVVSRYFADEGGDRFTEDGWFRTGDIVTTDARGYIQIVDRDKDLVKSGGEWISSVALENALMGHPAVAEAAVIAIPDARWGERPLAAVVLREGASAGAGELREYLGATFAAWMLPDRYEFLDEIPRNATGKFKKLVLRERFANDGK